MIRPDCKTLRCKLGTSAVKLRLTGEGWPKTRWKCPVCGQTYYQQGDRSYNPVTKNKRYTEAKWGGD
jgi:transposase-like protein